MIKIYYFSGTGNTAYVSQAIKAWHEEKGDQVAIMPLEKGELLAGAADLIYLGFPVYACDMPSLVESFIKEVLAKEQGLVKPFISYGFYPGGVVDLTKARLEAAGLVTGKSILLKMPGSDGLAFLKKTSPKAKRIVAHFSLPYPQLNSWLATTDREPLEDNKVTLPSKLTRNAFQLMEHWMKKKFIADENCVFCKKCQNICPVGNIQVNQDKVIFNKACILCLRCLHQCPQEAIQVGKITKGKFRYKGPTGQYRPQGRTQ